MRRENISCWRTICNAKSLFRFGVILQCLLIQAFIVAFWAFFLLFPKEVSLYLPKLLRSLVFSFENPRVAFWVGLYGLCASEVAFCPFLIVACCGTKAKIWLVMCIIANVFVEVHFLAFWALNLICQNSYNVAFYISSSLILFEALILVFNGIVLRVRIKESLVLHQAILVSRV